MKLYRTHTLKEIAEIINCTYFGPDDFAVEGLNEIHRVEPGDIVFVDHPKYYDKALQSKATVVLINKNVDCPEGKALLISDDPFRDFVKLGSYFKPFSPSNRMISETAVIGKGTHIQPGVFIGNHVKIGENCLIHSGVKILDHTVIGNHVTINSGTVIGSEAFYYKKRETGFDPLKSVGTVAIEDHVDIGANCTIDRGVTDQTIIGKGSKLDNLIQIGHDTVLGENCLVASQVGIAGCCTLGNRITLWGQVGIAASIIIEDDVTVLAQSGIIKNLKAGKTYFGSPAEEARIQFKKLAKINRL